MENANTTIEEPKKKSIEEIKNNFKRKREETNVNSMIDDAKAAEERYKEEANRRAKEREKSNKADNDLATTYRNTSIRILVSDLQRLNQLNNKTLIANTKVKYEHVLKAGIEYFESLSDQQLIKKINKYEAK